MKSYPVDISDKNPVTSVGTGFVFVLLIRFMEKPSSTLKTHARYKTEMPTCRLSIKQGLISYCPFWRTDIV